MPLCYINGDVKSAVKYLSLEFSGEVRAGKPLKTGSHLFMEGFSSYKIVSDHLKSEDEEREGLTAEL